MSPLFLFTILIPEITYMMFLLFSIARAYMCARYLFRVDLTLNRAIYRPFCHFYFEKWIIGHFSPIRCWFYAYLCSVKPTRKPAETSLFGLKLAESGRNPKWEISKQYLCRRFRILHFLENHIRVNTITENNKNYFNQQHQQLVSYLSLRFERFFQQLARQSTPCRAQDKHIVSTGI
mgnify:CR=1 FL=1